MAELTSYLPGFAAAYLVLLVGSLSPGPSVALLIGVATASGRKPALTTTLGIATGSLSLNVLTILGVGVLLSQAAWAMSIVRIIGAAYLLYLAYSAFRKALHPPQLHGINSVPQSYLNHFLTGYLLQVTNPKAIAFWLAISSIGAVEGAGSSVIGVFIVGAFLISFLCHGLWALLLSLSTVRQTYSQWRRRIEFVLGGLFTFAALRLIITEK